MIEFIKNNWMSLIALIISIISFFKDNIKDICNSHKKSKENRSAILKVSFINDKLIISNKGKSVAHNIRILIDDIEINKSLNFSVFAKQCDFTQLSSGNSVGIKIIKDMNSKTNFKIKVIWDDQNKKNNIMKDVINTL